MGPELKFIENSESGSQPIIFVHGGGISSRMWRYALDHLPEYHCIAPDLPGHGRSKEIRPCSLNMAVEGIASLIQRTTPAQKARLVGISVAVPVCVSLANRYPHHVEALFLSGPTPKFNPVAMQMMNVVSRPVLSLIGPERRAKIVGQMMNLSEKQMESFHDDLSQITPDLVVEINELVSSQVDPNEGTISAELFVGENELGSTKKRCRQLSEAYGNKEFAVVKNLGHAWPLEAPELFVDAIRHWVNGHRPMKGFRYIANTDAG